MSNNANEEASRAAKRKRVTASFEDRSWICTRADICSDDIGLLLTLQQATRNESDLCEYKDGHQPAPASSSSSSEVELLKARLGQLENHISHLVTLVDQNNSAAAKSPNTTTPYISPTAFHTPFSNFSTSTTSSRPAAKASALDRTFLALDDLSKGYSPASSSKTATPVSPQAVGGGPGEQWPSVFLGTDSNTITSRPTQTYEILSSLPPETLVKVLIDYHFEHDGVLWHFVQEDVFRLELEQFSRVRFTTNVLLVDPAWLALLIALLKVSSRSLLSDDLLTVSLLAGDTTMLEATCKSLEEAFDTALYCARALHRPQIRILQALTVMVSQLLVIVSHALRGLGVRGLGVRG
ncbi:uncharacterized protein IL334_006319 [Kwoniella shivajii]|uniref:Uncharacterized protein n=1 Tax=Kwoniella shivajii TaxID=564305 RepID=A0ABZ1D7I1_9TREE|nr:hypothetical protein IL334_006319 [Kwoniella shivajii]